MRLFDTHMHLNHPDFAGREEVVWQEALAAGVETAVVIGYDLESSRRAVELAERLPNLYASVGVSPHDYSKAPEGYIDSLRDMAAHPKAVAIGEAGLEYYYPAGPREFQIEHYVRQIELANELNKTLVAHLRDADADMLELFESHPPRRMILHCFTGSLELMQEAARRGHFVSLSGIVTFKSAKDLQAVAKRIPKENILIETDAPYLAPVPFRGKPCEPKMVAETARFLAALRGEDVEVFCAQTWENAKRAFGI